MRSATGPAPDVIEGPGFPELLRRASQAGGRIVHLDNAYAVRINAAHEQLGTLFIGDVGDLSDSDCRTVERAGMVTALVLLFERNAADARQSERNRVISDLIAGR